MKLERPTKELNSLPAVHQPVVVRKRDGHDGPDDDLALDDDGAVSDVVHACKERWW